MTRVMLVRHGETEWNVIRKIQGTSDVPLSAEGIIQAKLLAAHCPFETVDAIYSSDLSRAKDTAKIIAEKFNLPVQIVSEFREVHFGDWEGRLFSELEKNEQQNLETFFQRPDELKLPNAETFAQTQERAFVGLKKILDAHRDKNHQIIIAAHGAINRLLIFKLLDIPIRKMWALNQFNTAVNIFRECDGEFTIELINSTAHLTTDN